MAERDDLLNALLAARDARDAAASESARARERGRRLRRQFAQAERTATQDDRSHAQLKRLRLQLDEADADLRARDTGRAAAAAREAGLRASLVRLLDPSDTITRFDDSLPILLMPVRLETRFKTIDVAGAPPRHELWLRIFPDDCWIDGFEPTLTEAEVRNATTYWAGIWQAGGVEAQQRGAWADLVSRHGSGRAAWIVKQYRPLNEPAAPAKTAPDDLVLVATTETALAAAEEAALRTFWTAVWRAADDAAAVTAARAALDTAVGAARAAELVNTVVPVNIATQPPAGHTRATTVVSTAILVLPAVETRQASWSTAPKATLLPEAFMFLGYRTADDPNPIRQIGRPVPSPLVVGPDPSAPQDEQLQPDDDGNLVVPDALRWLSDFPRAVEDGMGMVIPLEG